jgi:hypothetical protein
VIDFDQVELDARAGDCDEMRRMLARPHRRRPHRRRRAGRRSVGHGDAATGDAVQGRGPADPGVGGAGGAVLSEDVAHVVPIGDLIAHQADDDCLDGRELREQAEALEE